MHSFCADMYDLYDLGRDNKGPGVDISCRRAVTASVQVLAVAGQKVNAMGEEGVGSWELEEALKMGPGC